MRHWCVRRRGSRSNTFIKYSDLLTPGRIAQDS